MNLNPDLILDLTATPLQQQQHHQLYVDAAGSEKQHMGKLPVIVANRRSKGR